MKSLRRQHGFTLVELMISSAVFSVVLLLCTFGLLQIARVYYKGVTATQTQERARSIMDNIAQDIQFSGGRVTPTTGARPDDFFCIGNRKYALKLGMQLVGSVGDATDEATRSLVAYDDPACSPTFASVAGAKELMSPNMRLARLDVQNLGGDLYKITIRVVSGDKDVLNNANASGASCLGGKDSTQFCAISELSTTVLKRVK